jgi:hypothetical protein
MSWAKRNLYFLISGIVAVVLLGLAGWYAYSASQSNSENGEQLKDAYGKLSGFATKSPNAGNENVNNIETAKEQTKQVNERVAQMEKFFTPIPGILTSNKFDDRLLSRAVRDTISQLRVSAQSHNVTLPVGTPEFAFSFTLQAGKITYDVNSGEMLSKQLGEVKAICEALYSSRIIALTSIQREHTADDVNPANPGTANDYCDSISLTNESVIIAPYQVTFDCFTPELGNVLSSFANQQHTIIVKTVNLQPADATMTTGYDMTAATQAQVGARGGLPTAVDEKKLRVTLLLDFVKIVPTQGR